MSRTKALYCIAISAFSMFAAGCGVRNGGCEWQGGCERNERHPWPPTNRIWRAVVRTTPAGVSIHVAGKPDRTRGAHLHKEHGCLPDIRPGL